LLLCRSRGTSVVVVVGAGLTSFEPPRSSESTDAHRGAGSPAPILWRLNPVGLCNRVPWWQPSASTHHGVAVNPRPYHSESAGYMRCTVTTCASCGLALPLRANNPCDIMCGSGQPCCSRQACQACHDALLSLRCWQQAAQGVLGVNPGTVYSSGQPCQRLMHILQRQQCSLVVCVACRRGLRWLSLECGGCTTTWPGAAAPCVLLAALVGSPVRPCFLAMVNTQCLT